MQSPRKKHHPLRTALTMLILATLAAFFLRWSSTALQVTVYEPEFSNLPEGFDGFRIVLLSDLHGAVFGGDNQQLFGAVHAQKPDLIAVTGDLIDEDTAEPLDYAGEIAAGLNAIVPVYYVTGNHEWAVGDVPELKKTLSANGVTVLSNQYVSLERDDDTLVIVGIDDPLGYADQKTPGELTVELYAEQGDPFWILLAHRNDRFENQYSLLGADLTLSGHGHGGIIRLPFTDGLLGTELNFFPSYTSGLYEVNGSRVLVSRGLGNVGITFRLFNRPEVAVITLQKG